MSALIYAAEITLWNPATQTETVRYVSSAALVTAPTDTPAHIAFDPCIQQPALMRQMIFDANRLFGASQISYGEMTLVNRDGHLDDWRDYFLDGRALVLRVGYAGQAYPSQWTTVLTAVMDPPEFDEQVVALRLRSQMARLDAELPMNRYAGDNSLPNGLEGTANDLADRYKPRGYGWPQNVSPPCVNTARLIYQWHDGAMAAPGGVYDRGVALTSGGAYSSQTDMETNAPAAGYYRFWNAGGCFRLGSSPAGQVTGTFVTDYAALDAARLLQALAETAGIAGGDIVAADVTALAAARPQTLGFWLDAPITARAAMDQVAQSVGACYWFDALGQLRMAAMTPPSGDPVAVLTADALIRLEWQASAVPVRQIEVRYGKNWTVQNTDLAGSVAADYRAWLAQEWRSALADGVSATDHPTAGVLSIDSLLVDFFPSTNKAAAENQAAYFSALFGTPRDRVVAQVRLDTDLISALALNAVVQVVYPRFGYGAGKLLRVIGLEVDLRIHRAEITLWG